MKLRPAKLRRDAQSVRRTAHAAGVALERASALADGAEPEASTAPTEQPVDAPMRPVAPRMPVYPRLLRLRHVHPNGWQRAMLGEGMAVVGALLALADVATAWSVLVLPAAVAAVVKGHDLLAGVLQRSQSEAAEPG